MAFIYNFNLVQLWTRILADGGQSCIVCLDDINPSDDSQPIVQPVGCSHVFHLGCVARERRCPICRSNFYLSQPSGAIVSRHMACMEVWKIIVRSRQFREQVHQVMDPLTADEWLRIVLVAYEDHGGNVEAAFMAEVQPAEQVASLISPRRVRITSSFDQEMMRRINEYIGLPSDDSQAAREARDQVLNEFLQWYDRNRPNN